MYFIEYILDIPLNFFLFSTWYQYWFLLYSVWNVMQFVQFQNGCTLLAHTFFEGFIWNHKIIEQSLDFHLGFRKHLSEVENASGKFSVDFYNLKNIHQFHLLEIFIYLFKGCLDNSVVYPFLACFFSWLYLNGHQISPYLALKIMAHILQTTYSNVFFWKKKCYFNFNFT